MISVSGTTITMTRGDTAVIQIAITQGASPYVIQSGDEVRFAMRPAGLNSKGTAYKYDVCLDKDIDTATLILQIDPEDTYQLPFGEYVYDIQLTKADGTVDTFITTATLILAPEVGNEQYNGT